MLIVSLLTFAAFSVIPGDVARTMLGPNATEAQVAALRETLGTDKPLIVQYANWLSGLLTFDLGTSTTYNQPVAALIAQRLPVTLGMSLIAIIMVILISYPLAILSAKKPGKFLDQVFSVFGHILFAIPPFVMSLLLILLFANVFKIFSAGRYVSPSVNFGGFVGCLILPSLAVALPKIAMTFKFMRSEIIAQNASEYVKASKSHGLSDMRILIHHVLPNTTVSSVTVITLALSDILGGSLIVEQVFNLPGLGRLLLAAVSKRDFPLMSGMVFYLAAITVLLYFISDIISALADPRIRIK